MGTNYYWQTQDQEFCPHCDHMLKGDRTHIGKSSAGWEFSFHATPALRSWYDWKCFMLEHQRDTEIVNEYGDPISISEFNDIVEKRSHPRGLRNSTIEARDYTGENEPGRFLDPQGYSFSEREFS